MFHFDKSFALQTPQDCLHRLLDLFRFILLTFTVYQFLTYQGNDSAYATYCVCVSVREFGVLWLNA